MITNDPRHEQRPGPVNPLHGTSRRKVFIFWAVLTGLNILLTFVALGDTVPGSTTVAQLTTAHNIEWWQTVLSIGSFVCILSLLWHLLDDR